MRNLGKSRIFKTVLALALIVALSLGAALPALADAGTTATPSTAANVNLVKGKVASIGTDSKSFEVLNAGGGTTVITVDSDTKYYSVSGTPAAIDLAKTKIQEQLKLKKELVKNGPQGPGKGAPKVQNLPALKALPELNPENDSDMETILTVNENNQKGLWGKVKSWFNRKPKIGESAAFSDLAVGDGVVVKVTADGNLAKQVLIIKAPDIKTVKGTISAVETTSFTLTPVDSTLESLNLKWDANSRIILKGAVSLAAGQNAVAVYQVSSMTVKTMEVFPAAGTATTN